MSSERARPRWAGAVCVALATLSLVLILAASWWWALVGMDPDVGVACQITIIVTASVAVVLGCVAWAS